MSDGERRGSWRALLRIALPTANPRKSRPWAVQEVDTLIREASRLTVAELAALLNRSRWAIRTKTAHERVVLIDPVKHRGGPRRPLPWERSDVTDSPG